MLELPEPVETSIRTSVSVMDSMQEFAGLSTTLQSAADAMTTLNLNGIGSATSALTDMANAVAAMNLPDVGLVGSTLLSDAIDAVAALKLDDIGLAGIAGLNESFAEAAMAVMPVGLMAAQSQIMAAALETLSSMVKGMKVGIAAQLDPILKSSTFGTRFEIPPIGLSQGVLDVLGEVARTKYDFGVMPDFKLPKLTPLGMVAASVAAAARDLDALDFDTPPPPDDIELVAIAELVPMSGEVARYENLERAEAAIVAGLSDLNRLVATLIADKRESTFNYVTGTLNTLTGLGGLFIGIVGLIILLK